ncbi:MAG TPA: hypothetical protein VMF51_04430 [Nocardioides sp.]|uniref:hypothetical protein n=1 Tax=Nocardioides sp. TaxID=35761 RepID=UPI002CFC1CB5|nr:hypothetical protein [Nocardioides sp.]HTW14353.1 hypothetical protein [Nocardioides sp.]
MAPSLLPPAAAVHSADDQAPAYRRGAWDAWLHGRVGAVHAGEGLRLLVPMAQPTPAAVDLALRLYAVGSVELLD